MTTNVRHDSPPQHKDETTKTTTRREPLWPILVAREAHARVDGHVGMTLTIMGTSTLALLLLGVLFSGYIWPLWRRSWLTIWPAGVPEFVIALPLIGLLLGILFNKVWHGRLWAGGILIVYLVLHANLYLPPPEASGITTPSGAQATALQPDGPPIEQRAPADTSMATLPLDAAASVEGNAAAIPTTLQLRKIGPLIKSRPEIIVLGSATSLVPLLAFWFFGVLSLSFFWPSVLAVITMVNVTIQARDNQRHFNARRALDDQILQQRLAHDQVMAQHQFDSWHDEEEQLALANRLARRHQLQELQQMERVLGLTQDTSAPIAEVPQSNDALLANLVTDGAQQLVADGAQQ